MTQSMVTMQVPFMDLTAQYAAIRPQVQAAINEVCEAQQFILGPRVKRLEEALARLTGTRAAVGVSSGTDALLVSLMAIGLRPGEEVLTTPFTFFATAGAVSRLGGVPRFIDIDPVTYGMDAALLQREAEARQRAGAKLRAILPVHLYGLCMPMEPVLEVANRYGLSVIEDAAQAIGATWGGRPAGSFGTTGCFSFFPTKNLGAFGDGGLVVTNDDKTAERLRMLRAHGSAQKYIHPMVGGNFRLDELQAAVLLVKLQWLEQWSSARRAHAATYDGLFRRHHLHDRIGLPRIPAGAVHIFHQYVIRTPQRDALRRFLAERLVGTEVYYPLPLHLQECYRDLGYRKGQLPESERAAEEVLALPIFPELTPSQQDYVVEQIRRFFERTPV